MSYVQSSGVLHILLQWSKALNRPADKLRVPNRPDIKQSLVKLVSGLVYGNLSTEGKKSDSMETIK